MNERDKPTAARVIASLVAVARPVMSKQGWDRDTCIAGSRIGIEALKRYGVAAQPLSVGFLALNPAANAHRKGLPVPVGAKEPRIVYCHHRGPERPWKGHVVITTEGRLIDLTLDQFARPDLDLVLEPATFETTPQFLAGQEYWRELGNAGAIAYLAYPDDKEYEKSPSWQRTDLQKPVLDEVLRELAARVGE